MTPDRFRHVNNHLTPLAVLVVVPGLVVAGLPRVRALLSLGLLVYSVLVNYLSVLWLGQRVEKVAKFRVVSNYLVNIALVWLLYTSWPAIWLVLLLMAVGPALYQSRRDAALTGVAVAMLLLAVHGLLGDYSVLAWADAGVKACAIVVLSLFVSAIPAAASLE